ncbi:hypothetical protein C343_03112 [Cryptococcus neoformans C23]|nr:hypothetical protein C347_03175 [Cryptococcus neoformans var. grubii AD2-60a]OWZ44323.1 hypothetical protein C343_03112 [Cryptococcus neoformans var. grubii C23]OXC84792.1 hypothetical protein C344_02873 [Cryptococcus neoformans var. grubii AD1-7a]OXH33293.1 hypothetical protein J005_02960 [Cryptococcus neoformans var. grubii]
MAKQKKPPKYSTLSIALYTMPKNAAQNVETCAVCSQHPPKYRCSSCPLRYCSVSCYKAHKNQCNAVTQQQSAIHPTEPLGSEIGVLSQATVGAVPERVSNSEEHSMNNASLRPLVSLNWPPEPDPGLFTDPLLKDDPKPLRHEELLRIAQSTSLRALLVDRTLICILQLLDTLPPPARHSALSKLLGFDPQSLSNTSNTLINGRDSPPPLDELLGALARGVGETVGEAVQDEGWWLNGPKNKIWITEREKKLMRLFAGNVCLAIDGKIEDGDLVWGQGELAWDV